MNGVAIVAGVEATHGSNGMNTFPNGSLTTADSGTFKKPCAPQGHGVALRVLCPSNACVSPLGSWLNAILHLLKPGCKE